MMSALNQNSELLNLSICSTPFWDSALTWNTTDPVFTPCFVSTALDWTPATFLLLCFVYNLYCFAVDPKHKGTPDPPWTFLSALKLLTAILLTTLGVVRVVYVTLLTHTTDDEPDLAHNVSLVIVSASYLLLFCLLHFQRQQRSVNCGAVWFYLLLRLICTGLSVPTFYRFQRPPTEITLIYVESLVQFVLLLQCSVANHDPSQEPNQCPREVASFPSKLTFWWFNSLTFIGFRRPLTTDDLWSVGPNDQASRLFRRFNQHWQRQKTRSHNHQNHSPTTHNNNRTNVVTIFARQFGWYFLAPCVWKFLTDNALLVNPLVVKQVIAFVSDPTAPLWHGYFYTAIFVVTNAVGSFTTAYQQHRMGVLGIRARNCLLGALYRKSLTLSSDARRRYTTGEIINLMSVDCGRLHEMLMCINHLFTAPVQIAIALYLLWLELGPPVLGGLILMVVFIPLQSGAATLAKRCQERQMALKDRRMKAIAELLGGIKVLKLYAWESASMDAIQAIRERELTYIRRSGYPYTVFHMIKYGSPVMVTCLTFALYILLDPDAQLTAQKAFVSVALFNLVRIPLARMPDAIQGVILSSIATKRINRFLNADEVVPYVNRSETDSERAVTFENATLSWESTDSECTPTLSTLNLTVAKGQLVAVVGSVGSGKSSLLSALLGEMSLRSGSVRISADQRVGYVPQQAWIQNTSVRENIVFGAEWQTKRYQEVVGACALGPDLEMLPAGDLTEIGEKGINLSGGQKQRVSVARACYSDANLYLMDDPLSAVDSHVGKHMFTSVLHSRTGLLRNATRILVTNALYVLPEVDQIVLLKNGHIDQVDNYERLMQTNADFRELILNYTNVSVAEETEAPEKQSQHQQTNPEHQEEIVSLHSRLSHSGCSTNTRVKSTGDNVSESVPEKQNTGLPADKSGGKLVEAERTESGTITLAVYRHFFQSISWFWFGCIFTGHLAMIVAVTGSNIWLSHWTSDPQSHDSRLFYLTVYLSIGTVYQFLIMFSWISVVFGLLRGSRTLHWRLLTSVVHAPMHFFDRTPLGRILNRFSKDIDVLDTYISQNFRALMNTSFTVLATLFVVSYQTPMFLTVVVPFGCLYLFVQRFYVSSSRQLKRLESVTRSPIFSHFGETLNGCSTIRAYGAADRFTDSFDARVDLNHRCLYPNTASLCWLQIRLDAMSNCFIFFASLFAVLSKSSSAAADPTGSGTGLSLSYALSITTYMNMCVRWFADFESNIISVERISEYTGLESEAAWTTDADRSLARDWPAEGVVEFERYGTRYRPDLDLVLRSVSFCTKTHEKIGIVGRTGAGKSSLTLALFRLIEPVVGRIFIDGVNVGQLGLQTLRSRLTIIPQDPMLFAGTVRSNLDPFHRHSDHELWDILTLSHLRPFVAGLSQGLDHPVHEGGENLSVGQRQLVCLARALLRKSKILVLDEATAAVDLETDSLIQATIRTQFADCTVLTIAHRLNTILDSDRVMVLDRGQVAEFESPATLLADPSSIFYSLAKDAGIVQ